MAVLPGFTVPMLSPVTGCVHALSEYTSTFTAVIAPVTGMVLEAFSAPMVVSVIVKIVNIEIVITNNFEYFFVDMFILQV